MSMRKRILALCTGLIAAIGIGFLASPFLLSWHPSTKAKSARSAHDISTLQPGQFLIEPFKHQAPWDELVLIIRDWNGTVYSHLLATKEGKVLMPEPVWGLGYYQCDNFGPDLDSNGNLKIAGSIRCQDPNTPNWGLERWNWTYAGQAHHPGFASMYTPDHEIIGTQLYVNR